MVPSTGGVSVAVHDLAPAAPAGAPVIVFCHANGFHGRVWAPVAAHLEDRFACFAPDLRGHGDTRTPPDVDLAWPAVAADVAAVVDAVGPGPVIGVGWSLGGAAIVGAAARRAQLFATAWLYEPILFPLDGSWPEPEANPLAELARRRRARFDSVDDALARYRSRPPFDRCDPAAVRAYVEHGFRPAPDGDGVVLKCDPATEATVFEQSHTNEFGRLGDISMPVGVAAGGDGEPPAQGAPLVADSLPSGTFRRFDDLTHFGPLEDPAAIAAAVAEQAHAVVSS